MKVYVASSWRNKLQPEIVNFLKNDGHEVYDFRDHGFRWEDVDPRWEYWGSKNYLKALSHPVAEKGFKRDKDALDWCEVCICVLPCGRSSHLELGYAIGKGKHSAILQVDAIEPELMNKLADHIFLNTSDLKHWLTDLDVACETVTPQKNFDLS